MIMMYLTNIGHTLSSDGTTIRHRTFESRHITFSTPTYESDPSKPAKVIKTRVLAVSTAVNHTSDTQLRGLKEIVEKTYKIYNDSPLGQSKPALVVSFAANIRGLGSDHAEDQKKLSRGVKEWMITSSKYLEGLKIVASKPLQELVPIILQAGKRKMHEVGGSEVWDELTEVEREEHNKQAMEEVIEKFGAEAWAGLSDDDRAKAEVFVWAGCCMHKELNSVKGGARRMAEYWSTTGNIAPVKLMNQHKEMAVNAGSSDAALSSIGDSGGVKLTSLAGAIFRHKDDKRVNKIPSRCTSRICTGTRSHFRTQAVLDFSHIAQQQPSSLSIDSRSKISYFLCATRRTTRPSITWSSMSTRV
jgi:hypothetical protein